MKIAVASDDGKSIAAHLGRVRGFVICSIEDGKVKNREYRPNDFTGHARGLEGAGHEVDRHGPILAALSDCRAVISGGMGRRIQEDLARANIEVFVTEQTDVETAIEFYLDGKLVSRPDLGCNH
ncbi:MAG: NifB/NifX family molybdenum-iron cluster-binding protein [bacterium]